MKKKKQRKKYSYIDCDNLIFFIRQCFFCLFVCFCTGDLLHTLAQDSRHTFLELIVAKSTI